MKKIIMAVVFITAAFFQVSGQSWFSWDRAENQLIKDKLKLGDVVIQADTMTIAADDSVTVSTNDTICSVEIYSNNEDIWAPGIYFVGSTVFNGTVYGDSVSVSDTIDPGESKFGIYKPSSSTITFENQLVSPVFIKYILKQ